MSLVRLSVVVVVVVKMATTGPFLRLLVMIVMVAGGGGDSGRSNNTLPGVRSLHRPCIRTSSYATDNPQSTEKDGIRIPDGGNPPEPGIRSSFESGFVDGFATRGSSSAPITTTWTLNRRRRDTRPPLPLRTRNFTTEGGVGEGWDFAALGRMLLEVVKREMKECNLLLMYDEGYDHQVILDPLLRLENTKQVVDLNGMGGVGGMSGVGGCTGYLVMVAHPAPLLALTSSRILHWDYRGRYFIVLPTRGDLEAVVESHKGRKTENVAGAVMSEGSWWVYVSQLYRGEGVRRVGTWRGDRFTSPPPDLYPDKLSDLQGTTLQAVTFEWAPSVFYYRGRNGSVLFRYGTDIGVLETLAQVLNFTVEYQEPPRGERWGREEDNGTWSGMMGRLARDEVDIGLVDLYVTLVRVGILDYTAPYDSELSCFMARTEPPLPRWQALAYPFQTSTWLAVLLGLLVSGPVLYLLARGSASCGGQEASSLQSLSFSYYYALGLHCCEAQETLPQTRSTRIFVIFLWLYTITLTIAYSTNLTAFLLVSKAPSSLETIRELHGSGLEVSGVGKFYGDALGSASDPYLQSLEKRFQPYDDSSEIYPRVLSGRAVMIQNSPYLEFVAATMFTSRGQARMRLMKECFAPFSIAMSVQRHSPLKRKFDRVISWVVAAGLVRHSFLTSLRLYAQNTKELAEEDAAEGTEEARVEKVEGVTSLSLEHLQGIFFIIALGWLASSFIFFLEFVI